MEKEKYEGREVRSGSTKSNKTQRSPESIGKAEEGNGGNDEKMKGENKENDEKFKRLNNWKKALRQIKKEIRQKIREQGKL